MILDRVSRAYNGFKGCRTHFSVLCVSRALLICPPEIEPVHQGFTSAQDSMAGDNRCLAKEAIRSQAKPSGSVGHRNVSYLRRGALTYEE